LIFVQILKFLKFEFCSNSKFEIVQISEKRSIKKEKATEKKKKEKTGVHLLPGQGHTRNMQARRSIARLRTKHRGSLHCEAQITGRKMSAHHKRLLSSFSSGEVGRSWAVPAVWSSTGPIQSSFR
jgi:hypothetical protein